MLSDKLKELRKANNLTQLKFANIFNISIGTIAMWETNKRNPDAEMLKRIANYFNVSLDYLLENETTPKDVKAADDDIKFALFNGSEGITDEMFEEVKQFAEMVRLREEAKKNKKEK